MSTFLPFNDLGLDFSIVTPTQKNYTGVESIKLKKLTCQNTLFNPAAWQRMIDTPPVDLTQPYFKCQAKRSAALISSFGSAAGTASLLCAISVSIVLGGLTLYMANHGSRGAIRTLF
jgi:hypothetical protein